jgi:hypothetical protein
MDDDYKNFLKVRPSRRTLRDKSGSRYPEVSENGEGD